MPVWQFSVHRMLLCQNSQGGRFLSASWILDFFDRRQPWPDSGRQPACQVPLKPLSAYQFLTVFFLTQAKLFTLLFCHGKKFIGVFRDGRSRLFCITADHPHGFCVVLGVFRGRVLLGHEITQRADAYGKCCPKGPPRMEIMPEKADLRPESPTARDDAPLTAPDIFVVAWETATLALADSALAKVS